MWGTRGPQLKTLAYMVLKQKGENCPKMLSAHLVTFSVQISKSSILEEKSR